MSKLLKFHAVSLSEI